MLESASRGGFPPGPQGVSLPGGFSLPGTFSLPGGVLPAQGVLPAGGVLPARGSLPAGGFLPARGFSGEPPLWTEWMTDTCKNITLATTSLRPVIKLLPQSPASSAHLPQAATRSMCLYGERLHRSLTVIGSKPEGFKSARLKHASFWQRGTEDSGGGEGWRANRGRGEGQGCNKKALF